MVANSLNDALGNRVKVTPLEDSHATGNFEVIALQDGKSIALHEKVGKGQGHVDTDAKVCCTLLSITSR